ncbi:MAG TPA: putative inorganic carbon transporter subunit DabA, partial [Pirellulaceae bacterium]
VSIDQRAFLIFQLAQLCGWQPETLHRLSPQEWTTLIHEIEAFSGPDRRRVYHWAYERQYRQQALDALVAHGRSRSVHGRASAAPDFQLICCIDEREESFRRHLEEIAPHGETFGAAGFFAVAMNYRGAADAHYTPLCPVMIQPRHYVREEVATDFQHAEHQRRQRRRTIGTVTRHVHVGSRTFAGGWLAAVLGSLASLPLVARILFPRATARFRRAIGGFVRTPAITQLQLERTHELPSPDEGHVGFSVAEMASLVERLLRDIGLTKAMARLVIVTGHGSSSLNNPHESAHDCGACGGGRGGPNARAFAHMANDPRIRKLLAQQGGVEIPDDTVFVGAYHNTCDESVTYYDLDRIPSTHDADLARARVAIDEARRRNAHERCRRFESAPLKLNPEAALRHVEARAEDLSQVRPEYGHATNALCFVGRRSWSRGLYLDRRAFLHSYDPTQDDAQHTILTRILQAVVPVCAGINLEYYFSVVDPSGYGCGTKLPHNITSLLGVMNGAASDLRPGLPWQMVEIHEPVRLLFVIETTPAAIEAILDRNPSIARLVHGRWVQLATFDPRTGHVQLFENGDFRTYVPTSAVLPEVAASADWYRGWREHLGFASVARADSWKGMGPDATSG